MDRRGRRQALTGVDHRLRRARSVDHVAQTTGQRVVDVTLGQQTKEVDRQWLGEETPVIRVRVPANQLVEIAEVAGNRVATEKRLVHVRIGSGTRSGRLERTQDRLEPASFRCLAGQRDSPSWVRADPDVGWTWGFEADPGFNDFLGATPDLSLPQRWPQEADPRPREHLGDPWHTDGVRGHHAVDLRDQARRRRKDGISVHGACHRPLSITRVAYRGHDRESMFSLSAERLEFASR